MVTQGDPIPVQPGGPAPDDRHTQRPAGVPSDAKLYSFSGLSTYRGCGRKYQLLKVEHVDPEPQGALIGGRAVHQTIETAEGALWWREDPLKIAKWGRAEFYRQFHSIASEVAEKVVVDGVVTDYKGVRWGGRTSKAFPLGENVAWWEREGPVMLQRWAQLRRDDPLLGYTLLESDTELEVTAMLTEDIYVRGFVDAAMLVNENGERVVRDWKTGTYKDPSQLAVYAWLLREGPGLVCTVGEFVMLRQQHNMVKAYDLSGWIDTVPAMFANLTKGLELGLFPIVPSNFCGSCTVRAACEWGKHLP